MGNPEELKPARRVTVVGIQGGRCDQLQSRGEAEPRPSGREPKLPRSVLCRYRHIVFGWRSGLDGGKMSFPTKVNSEDGWTILEYLLETCNVLQRATLALLPQPGCCRHQLLADGPGREY